MDNNICYCNNCEYNDHNLHCSLEQRPSINFEGRCCTYDMIREDNLRYYEREEDYGYKY